tara:strand:- start:983 stop:1123 length:141 start_codon:yes stop_codon:yes gene_type:complete
LLKRTTDENTGKKKAIERKLRKYIERTYGKIRWVKGLKGSKVEDTK